MNTLIAVLGFVAMLAVPAGVAVVATIRQDRRDLFHDRETIRLFAQMRAEKAGVTK